MIDRNIVSTQSIETLTQGPNYLQASN